MPSSNPRTNLFVIASILSICAVATFALRARVARAQGAPSAKSTAAAQNTAAGRTEALRFNTLGVAYMNQQKFADAQKKFEQALSADPTFAVARVNLGVALLSQQKLEPAREALEEAAHRLPQDPYAWYNLGLVYKDSNEIEKGIAAFHHVTELTPEADGFYFVGYLQSQSQHYDEAIAAFQKALAAYPFHASAEFGLARAFQRKGDATAAREHLARFQKITTEHLEAPFGAGYGDQGRYSLAELPRSSVVEVPAAIPVRFMPQVGAFVAKPGDGSAGGPGPSTGACFFDYDGDGKPDLFLVSGDANGRSRLLH